ncbi:MCE family protein [Fodinicola acaciae]|uniref:MCE family protein n=1 Tax=Fodinicola acaciae TaxID=2681555 RepID=UPI0013D6A817|nr:MCE family protein [Fodinicola acaciae]
MRSQRIIAVIAGLAVLIGGGYVFLRPDPALTVSADFAHADGVFAGSKVAILGVPVGQVTAVEPRGAVVRVFMRLPRDLKIPANAQAWITTPSVIADHTVEFTPAYRGGSSLEPGAIIPAARTHSPIKWAELVRSLDTLLTGLGPNGLDQNGSLGTALHSAATALRGNGTPFRSAVQNLAQASGVLANDSDDVGALITSLNKLVSLLVVHRSSITTLTTTVTAVAGDLNDERATISAALSQLATVLTQVAALVRTHGSAVGADLTRLNQLTGTLVAHQQDLAEILDVLPLASDNLGRAVGPDGRLRVRLDISTTLTQLDATRQLCQRLPVPLCAAPGVVNPIPFPPSLSNPLTGGGR